ncbi:MAG: PEP-utilizing enzyme, partial [Nanoarchaeota archaeon]
KMTWQKLLAREGVDITTISGLDVVFYDAVWQFAEKKEELFFTYFRGKNLTHYINVDPKELGRFLYKKHFHNPEQIKQYYENGQILIKEIKETAEKWKKEAKTNEEVLKAYNEFKKQFMQINYIYSILSWLAIEAWQADFEQLMNSMIKRNKLETRQDEILTTAYTPWKKTALHEIPEKISKGVSPKKIAEEYQFLRSFSVIWYRPLDEAWIKNIIPQSHENGKSLTQKQMVTLLNPTAEEKKFLEQAPYIIFFKDWRDDLRRMHCYSWTFLFEEIARVWNVQYEEVGYLTLDEIESGLNKKNNPKEIIARRKVNPCIITCLGKELKITVLDKDIPKKYENVVAEIENKGKGEVITGLVAFKGKMRGKVKIIRSYHDIKNVEIGDILVANTTHPTYLPAMQKAAAFVTNEGGIISHAAIVAREMKKPCIVGTKIATKVLKDGDMVEVDAEKGIVRRI